MPLNKTGPIAWAVGLCCLAALLLVARGQPTARTVLAFLPPARSATQDRSSNLPAEWESPVELAAALLQDSSATDSICSILEKSKDDAKERALKHVFALSEDDKLTCTTLNENLLELTIVDSDGATAKLYSRAAVEYLKDALQRERSAKQDNSELQSSLVEANGRLKILEGNLMLLAADKNAGPGSRLAFALDHYREAVSARRRAENTLQDWRDQVAARAPEFTVVSGPVLETRRTGQSLAAGALATVGLICLLASRSR